MALLIVLLVLFLVAGGVGLFVKGLIWLAIAGLALFVITGIVGIAQRKTLLRRRRTEPPPERWPGT